jgi:hypothetical protein
MGASAFPCSGTAEAAAPPAVANAPEVLTQLLRCIADTKSLPRRTEADADALEALLKRQPEAVQRTALDLANRLQRHVPDRAVLLGMVSYWVANRDAIREPFAYFNPASDGFVFVEREVRLALNQAAHQRAKDADAAALPRRD